MMDSKADITNDLKLGIIDLDLAKTQTGHNKEFVMELLGVLCSELPKEIQLIKEAYVQNNIDQLQDLLHKLKGGLYYCGVPQFQKATIELQNALKKVGHVTEVQFTFECFIQESDNLLLAYDELLKKQARK